MRDPNHALPPRTDSGRRYFLQTGVLNYLGIHLSQLLAARSAAAAAGDSVTPAKAQACIMLWLDGGASHIDTFDPKPRSSFKPISTNVPGIQVSELLLLTARQMDKISIIRAMRTEENNHIVGHHYVATGHRPNPAMQFPSFPSIVAKEAGARKNMPANIMVPSLGLLREQYFKSHFIGAQHDPLVVQAKAQPAGSQNKPVEFELPDLSLPQGLTMETLSSRHALLKLVDRTYREKAEQLEYANLDMFREQAWNIVLSAQVREAFDLSKEPAKVHESYGKHTFGQSVLLARRLVEAGARFVTASGFKIQQWDTHANNDKILRETLVPPFDQALSALLTDLKERGMLDSTVVLVMGEFGRTDDLNANGGRDHWCHCWSVVAGGGGIRGGHVVGASDERGAYPAGRVVSMGDLFATVYKAFGIDWRKEYMHPIGRPLKIANSLNNETGVPLPELI